MRQATTYLSILVLAATLVAAPALGQKQASAQDFLALLIGPLDDRVKQVNRIGKVWDPSYTTMLVEVLRFSRDPATRDAIVKLLQKKTKQRHGNSLDDWNEWIWSQEPQEHAVYPQFKSLLYRNLDPKFGGYFGDDKAITIRLDEVQWGGVVQDGIPPLHGPKMISADEATYLGDRDIVFGIEIDGDVRAYPKRILAWHEMFTDVVGGVPIAGVYCTLCGSVVVFETFHEGVQHDLGTSGFLYRSNKLMFDHATQSLWNTLWGRPVIGPLAEKDIQLVSRGIVTSRWSDWRERHPNTTVLSLETGHERDYSEGAAYRDYFATDELMFTVPEVDKRLKNKAEVLALTNDDRTQALAISADFLAANPVHHQSLGELELVVLTDSSGANRAYASAGKRFASWDKMRSATDAAGESWSVTEDALVSSSGETLARYPAHRAFWFGWYAAYPDTELVH